MFYTRALFFILLIFKGLSYYSQAVVHFQGDVTDDKGSLAGVQVQVAQGGRVENTIMTDGSGKYSFSLPLGGDFLVTVSKDFYVTKKFTVNTGGVPPEKAATKFPIIQASLGLFKKMPGVDYSALNQPLNKYKYNPLEDNFEYDAGYLDQMITKLGAIKDAEKEVIKKEKEKEAAYVAAVKQGDKLFESKDYESAVSSYNEALKLKPVEVYPTTQISNANRLIELDKAKKAGENAAAKAKADAEAKKIADVAAAKAKAEADAIAKIKADGEAAKAKADADALAKKQAEDAAAKKAADAAATKAQADADALAKKQADEAANKAKTDQEKADKLAREKTEADARAGSEKAKAEADALAKKQADEAAAKRSAMDAAEKAKADKEAADKLAKEKAAAEAIAKKQAEADALEKSKANEENKKTQENESKYKSILAKGDDAFNKNDFASAKASFTEASAMRPTDSYPKNRLIEVGYGLKYGEAVKVGDDLFNAKRHKEAKKKYEEALTFKGGDAYAKDRLVECEKLINADDNQKTDERVKQLLAKYGPGVTEETISANNVVIIQRVVVRDNMAWVFQKKIFNWGGTTYFRDNTAITESTFELETKP